MTVAHAGLAGVVRKVCLDVHADGEGRAVAFSGCEAFTTAPLAIVPRCSHGTDGAIRTAASRRCRDAGLSVQEPFPRVVSLEAKMCGKNMFPHLGGLEGMFTTVDVLRFERGR